MKSNSDQKIKPLAVFRSIARSDGAVCQVLRTKSPSAEQVHGIVVRACSSEAHDNSNYEPQIDG